MTRISDALAAMGKATPGPLAVQESRDGGCTYSIIAYDERGAYVTASVNTFSESSEGIANAKEYAAAPDMAAWIKKALPYIEGIKEGMEAPLMVQPEKYDELCALLAEAKGDNHAEN